jgi:hypothetical protein
MQQTNRPQLKPVDPMLPEHRQKQVESGLATFQSVLAERDNAERKWNEAVVKIAALDQQLASMQGVVNMMESAYLSSKADLEGRVREYQQQRDLAVAKVSRLEAILASCALLLNGEMQAAAHDP